MYRRAAEERPHDGRIARAEFISASCLRTEAHLKRPVPRCAGDMAIWFSALDVDHDGELSHAEHDRMSKPLFRQNDRNHDGFVTEEKMRATAAGK